MQYEWLDYKKTTEVYGWPRIKPTRHSSGKNNYTIMRCIFFYTARINTETSETIVYE